MFTNLISEKLFWRNLNNLLANRVDYSYVLFLIQMLAFQISDTFDAISNHRIVLFNSANLYFIVVVLNSSTFTHRINYQMKGRDVCYGNEK